MADRLTTTVTHLESTTPRDMAHSLVLNALVGEMTRLARVPASEYLAALRERCLDDARRATIETDDGSDPEDVREATAAELLNLLGYEPRLSS